MAWEQKNNTGSLFKNQKKGDVKERPDYTGSILVDGVEYWLSAWIKKGEKTWMSLSVQTKDKQESRGSGERQTSRQPGEDIPF